MAAILLQPQSVSFGHPEIMPPSPLNSQDRTRHGRGKHGGSIAKGAKSGRVRGYSVVDDREAIVSRALTKLLRRAKASEAEREEESESDEETISVDADGWANCEEVLRNPSFSAISASLEDLQSISDSSAFKSRFALKSTSPDASSPDASSYLIRSKPNPHHATSPKKSTDANAATDHLSGLRPITLEDDNIPETVVYGTTYANYPLVLNAGSIRRAGGQKHISFSRLDTAAATGSDKRGGKLGDAEVLIHVDVRGMLAADPAAKWFAAPGDEADGSGAPTIVTDGETVQKRFWKKAVGKRADVGLLFADGMVLREVPVGLRGKGAKGKKGRGSGKVGAGGAKGMAVRAREVRLSKSRSGSEEEEEEEVAVVEEVVVEDVAV